MLAGIGVSRARNARNVPESQAEKRLGYESGTQQRIFSGSRVDPDDGDHLQCEAPQ